MCEHEQPRSCGLTTTLISLEDKHSSMDEFKHPKSCGLAVTIICSIFCAQLTFLFLVRQTPIASEMRLPQKLKFDTSILKLQDELYVNLNILGPVA